MDKGTPWWTDLRAWYEEDKAAKEGDLYLPAWYAFDHDPMDPGAVAIVAWVEPGRCWAAYCGRTRKSSKGTGIETDDREIWEDVAHNGQKLNEDLARVIFPFITEPWR